MTLEVTFREYTPEVDGERGEFLGSFKEKIEGKNPQEVLENASKRAKELSEESKTDVRVWEVPIRVTPRGITQ